MHRYPQIYKRTFPLRNRTGQDASDPGHHVWSFESISDFRRDPSDNGSDRRNAGDDFCSYDGKQRWLRWRLCTGRCVRDDDMQHCDTAVYLLAFAVHIIRKKKKIKLCRNGSGKRLIFFFCHLRDITGEQ